jgi:hypothetical protein
MKRLIVGAVLGMMLGAGNIEQTWTGVISDAMCGASHKSMPGDHTDRECTLACAQGGSAYALVSAGKVYKLTSHEADLKTHAGHTVNVTGALQGDTIKVSKIEMKSGG